MRKFNLHPTTSDIARHGEIFAYLEPQDRAEAFREFAEMDGKGPRESYLKRLRAEIDKERKRHQAVGWRAK